MQHRTELRADDIGMARHPRQHDELGNAAHHGHEDGEDREQPEQPPLRAVQVATPGSHGRPLSNT
jgi:hypothetical protein